MDYKALLAKVEKTIEAMETTGEQASSIALLAETITRNFVELGITGGRLYAAQGDKYELTNRFGKSHEGELGIMVPKDYKPIELVLENGVVVMEPTDPGVDPVLEQKLGARRFAAIAVGDEDYILSFNVSADSSRDDLLYSLNLVRYAMTQKLRADRYLSIVAEAQRIQQSILPQRVPSYVGFDIYGKNIPAETVSGDFYDFVPISDSILGLAIADASGHGLPAALVVRDIHMGLRMGADRDFKIIRTMEKLNQILHRSRITTKFVSLFYGELERTGTFIYVNAGHNPPLLMKGNKFELLRHGGPILGPTPDASYNRGYTTVDPGDILCLYTDGIVEACDSRDREFGIERLQLVIKNSRAGTAQEIAQEIFRKVERWGKVAQDDRTVVIVKGIGAA